MAHTRRTFLSSAGVGAGLLVTGSLSGLLGAPPAGAVRRGAAGYGNLVPDPAGILDLPPGFQYRAFSREAVDLLNSGLPVPAAHDGMAAFPGPYGRVALVRNHELTPDDVVEDGLVPVPRLPGVTYDPDTAAGGTTSLVVSRDRRLLSCVVSLAGTYGNCAGGPTPWGTWLTCEEEFADGGRPHGYVFEVDPWRGGDPTPIAAMGRFEHEAVAFDPTGTAYLTEDAGGEGLKHGLVYRFQPSAPLGGRGSLHQGGALHAMKVPALGGDDLSAVTTPGTRLTVTWSPVANVDPATNDIRFTTDATPVHKAEGIWWGHGSIWFVSSYAAGPDAEDLEDVTVGVHGGQIWRYDPVRSEIELVAVFDASGPYDGPDNITVSPYGYALACTDGEDDQWLVGITPDHHVFPFGYNRFNTNEFAGATFSPDGRTLFVNMQEPGQTFAIWGPWRSLHR